METQTVSSFLKNGKDVVVVSSFVQDVDLKFWCIGTLGVQCSSNFLTSPVCVPVDV